MTPGITPFHMCFPWGICLCMHWLCCACCALVCGASSCFIGTLYLSRKLSFSSCFGYKCWHSWYLTGSCGGECLKGYLNSCFLDHWSAEVMCCGKCDSMAGGELDVPIAPFCYKFRPLHTCTPDTIGMHQPVANWCNFHLLRGKMRTLLTPPHPPQSSYYLIQAHPCEVAIGVVMSPTYMCSQFTVCVCVCARVDTEHFMMTATKVAPLPPLLFFPWNTACKEKAHFILKMVQVHMNRYFKHGRTFWKDMDFHAHTAISILFSNKDSLLR